MFRAAEVPYAEDYIIGPLPITRATQVRPLNYAYNRGDSKVPLPIPDLDAIKRFDHEAGMSIADITDALWNAVSGNRL
jgi:primary-amine oxidase